ncbi:MAG: RAMP superfamily CRISPR-associated protein [Candidatus Bathyarchaeia archaeon]
MPGSVIRGSIGFLLKRVSCRLKDGEKHGEGEECIYHQLIEDENGGQANAFFRYAYPIHIGCGGIFYPTPKTISVCRNPQCNYIIDGFSPPLECPQCGRTLRPGPRYVCSKCGKGAELPVSTFRVTMTSINRDNNTASYITDSEGERRGTLHTLELIEAGAQFKVQVVLNPDVEGHDRLMARILEQALSDEGVGAAKSRGLGKLRTSSITVTKVTPEIIRKRSDDLGDQLVMRLLSPMVVKKGEPLIVETLMEAARRAYSQVFRRGKPSLKEPVFKTERFQFTTYGGWSLRENRRRSLSQAIEPGSTYHLCSVDGELREALASLEQCYAIGGFKAHGCGQILLS